MDGSRNGWSGKLRAMARCIRCNKEVNRSYIYCYRCSRLPKPISPLTPPVEPPTIPTWEKQPPGGWHPEDRAPSPLTERTTAPTAPNTNRLYVLQRNLKLRSWKKENGRNLSVDNHDEKV